MRDMIKRLYQKFRHLILYGIIGSLSSGLDFGVYTLLVSVLSWNYILSNCLSVVVGIVTSFILNRSYNFKVTNKTAQRFSIFIFVGLTGMLLSNIILYCCVDLMHLNKVLSKLLSIVPVVLLQFLINKYITFKKSL